MTLDGWPALEVHLRADEDGDRFYDLLRAALERDEPFTLVAIAPHAGADPGRKHSASDVANLKWLKTARPQLAQRCRGIAYVVPAETLERFAKVAAAMPGMFGCPARAVSDAEEARAWAREQLTGAQVRT
jgi:hypothetical protein